MRRGEIWTAAAAGGYAGKPRPSLIVQNDMFGATRSVTICGLTSVRTDAALARIEISPTADNGLRQPCFVMTDKIVTVDRSKLGSLIGRLTDSDMVRVDRALLLYLDLATFAASDVSDLR